jgi:hypothetical protein
LGADETDAVGGWAQPANIAAKAQAAAHAAFGERKNSLIKIFQAMWCSRARNITAWLGTFASHFFPTARSRNLLN